MKRTQEDIYRDGVIWLTAMSVVRLLHDAGLGGYADDLLDEMKRWRPDLAAVTVQVISKPAKI